ncbi:16788_t:CDS:1, partial [Rhizophagus irregularis]
LRPNGLPIGHDSSIVPEGGELPEPRQPFLWPDLRQTRGGRSA